MGVRGAVVAGSALSLLAAVAMGAGQPAEYGRGLREFVTEMSRTHRFRSLDVDVLLTDAAYRQDVIDAIRRPYEAQPWYRYRALFVTPHRAGRGAKFMRDNSEALQRAQTTYGVPPDIVTAILGVETDYGGHLGDYPAVDALATLAFAYPPRAAFFRRERRVPFAEPGRVSQRRQSARLLRRGIGQTSIHAIQLPYLRGRLRR